MKDKFCTNPECKRKINYYNKVKGRPRCKMCERKYWKDLNLRKKLKQIELFLEQNPEVKKVKGYEDKYLISKEGIVYTATTKGVRELARVANKGGYYSVALFKNGKKNLQKIHRLVAFHFIPNDYPYVKKIINHKDGVKTNNHYMNLEWCTYKQNSNHASKTGLLVKGEEIKSSKLTEKEVLEIYQSKRKISYEKLAEKYKVSMKTIMDIIHNNTWKHVKRIKPKRRLLCNRKRKGED